MEESLIANKSKDPIVMLLQQRKQKIMMQNALKITKTKENSMKKNLDIKKKKIQKFKSMRQDQLIISLHKQNKQPRSLISRKENIRQFMHTMHCQSSTQKQKLQQYKKKIANERKESRNENQKKRMNYKIQLFMQKQNKRRSIIQFEKSITKKKEEHAKNYLLKVKESRLQLLKNTSNQCKEYEKSMRRLRRHHLKVKKSIENLQQEESLLYDNFSKVCKTRNSLLIDSMIKSVVID